MTKPDSTRSHGLAEANMMGVREYIRGYSLIDITNTGVLAAYNKNLPAFMDNANQVVKDEESWNRSRNQQRNWETLTQLMGMIAQPSILQQPVMNRNQDLSAYKFSFLGTHTVWDFTITAEQSAIFDSPLPAGRLVDICHKIPVITGLKETIELEKAIFDTQDQVNLYFEKIEFS